MNTASPKERRIRRKKKRSEASVPLVDEESRFQGYWMNGID
jgi:hypothetical protein